MQIQKPKSKVVSQFKIYCSKYVKMKKVTLWQLLGDFFDLKDQSFSERCEGLLGLVFVCGVLIITLASVIFLLGDLS